MLRFVLLGWLAFITVARTQTWCGKHYAEPGPYIPFPNPLKDKNMIVTPGLLPYDNEVVGDIVATIRELSNFPYTFRATIKESGAILAQVAITNSGRNLVQFNVRDLPLRLAKTDVECVLLDGESVLANEIVEMYHVPYREETVKVNYVTHGYFVSDKPFFPFGYFYNWGEYLKFNISLLDEMKRDGYNVFQARPSLLPESLWQEFMDRSHQLGLKVHFSLEHYYQDLDLVRYHINKWKDHPAIFAWYTADEPDGKGIDASVVLAAQELIKELDPYHPTTVVLNCQVSTPAYWHTTDVLMADPYPIGVNMTLCNSTYGVCGCDDCLGDATDAPNRVDVYHRDTNFTKPVWIIPQSFGNSEWWDTQPTPQQGRYMTYAMIVHGAKNGVLYFMRGPTNADVLPDLYAETTRMATEMTTVYPYILNGEDFAVTASPSNVTDGWGIPIVDARAWNTNGEIMLIITNSIESTVPFTIKFAKPVYGIRRIFSEDDNYEFAADELHGILIPNDVHVYIMFEAKTKYSKFLEGMLSAVGILLIIFAVVAFVVLLRQSITTKEPTRQSLLSDVS